MPGTTISEKDTLAAMAASGLRLVGFTRGNPIEYRVGDEIDFVFVLMDPAGVASGTDLKLVWRLEGDDGTVAADACPISLCHPATVRTSLKRAGFVHVMASVSLSGEKTDVPEALSFEGGAGADIGEIRPAATKPDDFDAYWARQRALLDAVPLEVERHHHIGAFFPDGTRIPDSLRIYTVKITCAGPNPVTGFLAVPKGEGGYPARVIFDGYSKEPKICHRMMTPGVITFHVNAHGYELFRDEEYYAGFFAQFEKLDMYGVSPVENADPDTAYFRGMALRAMRAFDYLRTLPEWNGRDLIATGGSQGGLQAIWSASLVPEINRCEPSITWCCNLAGAEIDGRLPGWHPVHVRGLDYFDPVFHAARIGGGCFVDMQRIGLGDYTCPPSGITAAYNSISAPKRAAYYQNSTHMYVPPEPGIFMRF